MNGVHEAASSSLVAPTFKTGTAGLFFVANLMMLGSKGILTPLIPDCYVLCTRAIFKNIRNVILLMFLAGQEVKKPLASKLASAF